MNIQNPFLPLKGVGGSYSALYILGTALAIAFTMLIAEVYYVKTANIAPEVRRSKTYYLDVMRMKDNSRGLIIPPALFRDMFQKMQTPECMTAVMDFYTGDGDYMKLPDGIHDHEVKVKMTEPGFFRFFQFRFIEGAPFTQDDFDSGRSNVVITEEVRSLLFPKEAKAVGSTVTFRHQDYRICGVVETPSELTEKCVADIYVPYAADGLLQEYNWNSYEDGCVEVYFSVPAAKRKAFMQEMKEVEARYNAMHADEQVDMTIDMESHYATVWKSLGYVFDAWGDSIIWYVLPGVLLLLVVP
ncbi:MAG: ABC transporter permease, partial [Bacteroidaceae bacterium]|nr:ABC transporter permease [Bacteroidaceae bacterium]